MKNYLIHNALFLIGAAFVYPVIQYHLSMWLSIAITMTIVTIIGVGKELYDKRKGGKFDWRDILADELGGAEGIMIVILLIKR